LVIGARHGLATTENLQPKTAYHPRRIEATLSVRDGEEQSGQCYGSAAARSAVRRNRLLEGSFIPLRVKEVWMITPANVLTVEVT